METVSFEVNEMEGPTPVGHIYDNSSPSCAAFSDVNAVSCENTTSFSPCLSGTTMTEVAEGVNLHQQNLSLSVAVVEGANQILAYPEGSTAPFYVNALPLDGNQQTIYLDNNHHHVTQTSEGMGVGNVVNLPIATNPLSLSKVSESEQPLFVNAKQYHRILKRREARAKLEARGRIFLNRSKYLYSSRHLHAKKRIRGPGGKFLKQQPSGKKDV